jgi:hypothetical protein
MCVFVIHVDVRIFSLYNNTSIFMLLREIMEIQCAHRWQHHAVDVGSYNSACRWISHNGFSVIFIKNHYFEEILEA